MTETKQLTLAERIEVAYNRAIEAKKKMQNYAHEIASYEESAKMENLDEWTQAKNNDIRRAIILRVLADDLDYHGARAGYHGARDNYRLALLEIERLKLLVELAKAGDR